MRRFVLYQAQPIEDTSAPELYIVAVFDEAGRMVYSGTIPPEANGLIRELLDNEDADLTDVSRLFAECVEWPKLTGMDFRECFLRSFILVDTIVSLHVRRGGQPVELPKFDEAFWRDALK